MAASILWFLFANTLGLLLGTGVLSYAWQPAHAHANLLGFVSMMIYGVAYHALPRFRGMPFTRVRAALAQVVLANLGLAGMVAAWGFTWPTWTFAVAGSVTWVASVMFVALIAEVLLRRPPYAHLSRR